MGYTHYFNLGKKPTQKKWDVFTKECKVLHDNLPDHTNSAGGFYEDHLIIIRGGNGFDKPEITNDHILFNGDGSQDLDHETFYLEKTCSDFCKTARKPYDLLVFACLISANRNVGLLFGSDGFTDYKGVKHCKDLLPAMNYYNETIKPETLVTEKELWLVRKKFYKK